MKKLINLPIVKCKYEDAEECIRQITEAKEDHQDIIGKHLEDQLDEKYKAQLLETLSVRDFSKPVLHTAVLYDDAIEVFRKRKSPLFRMLFENRQPKITFFLCMQDPIGLDASIKSNMDSCWLFGGFSPQKFNYIYQQLSSPLEREAVYEIYKQLTTNQAVIFDYSRS